MENLGDYRARLLVVLAMLISVDLIDGARTYAVANDNDGGFRAVLRCSSARHRAARRRHPAVTS